MSKNTGQGFTHRTLTEKIQAGAVAPKPKSQVHRCPGCNYPVAYEGDYCGECLCEDDCGL